MAVPFSKPLYPGGPPRRIGPQGRGRSQHHQQRTNTQRPSNQQYEPAHQHQNQFPEQTSTQPQQNYQHPIERFLYGDGVIQLDRLSRVTRLAFYALFEAWRLLQDLSPNQTRSITQGQANQHQNIGHQTPVVTQLCANNRAPVQQSSTCGLTVVEASNAGGKVLPDVVLASTQSQNSNLHFNGDSMNEHNIIRRHSTPKKNQSCGQVGTSLSNEVTNQHDNEIWRSPRNINNISNGNIFSDSENEEFSITNNNRNRRDSEANYHHLEKNRKFIDDQEVRIRNMENTKRSTRLRKSSFSTSDLPDLIPLSEREEFQHDGFNLMNCDYSGGIQKFDDDVDHLIDQIDFGTFSPFNSGKKVSSWEKGGKSINDPWYDDGDVDYDEEYDDMVSDDKKILSRIVSPNTTLDVQRNRNNCPWSNSGMLLIELASAFEMSYGVAFENDQERQQYDLYRRMKADILRNQSTNFYGDNDQNTFGVNLFELGKAVLSQALLTGMWYMMKKIKIV